ncbi:NAD(P)-binding protein, partial [Leptospira sp. 201903070]
MDLKEKHYDLILIGSGIGALTVASLMAQYRDKKVLILEQHFKAGGFTHVFKREG